MAIRYTLGKNERLKREQHIETLFRSGKAFSVFPLRLIWLQAPRGNDPAAIKAGFSVPKKKFRRATDRNRIKRLLREAWRLNRHLLLPLVPPAVQLHVFLIFTDQSLPDYPAVEAAVCRGIDRLCQSLQQAGNVHPQPL